MKVALVQLEVKEKNTAENRKHGLELLRKAAANSDLAILPEIWTTGYSLGRLKEEAEEPEGELMREISAIAAENSCAIIPGSLPMKLDGKIYNCSPAINSAGKVVNMYSKAHLFGMFKEERFFAAGDNFSTFELNGWKCASAICYDLRFPEYFRYLALQGAELIVVPAEWPEVRGEAFDLLARARAMENRVFVAVVNCSGYFGDDVFYGYSKLIGPEGNILDEAGKKEGILYVDISKDELTEAREYLNVLPDVRMKISPDK